MSKLDDFFEASRQVRPEGPRSGFAKRMRHRLEAEKASADPVWRLAPWCALVTVLTVSILPSLWQALEWTLWLDGGWLP